LAWSKRVKDLVVGALIVLALVAGFFIGIRVLGLFHHSACNRLNGERLSHLEPGHEHPGPGSIYVIGVGPGPPPSELDEYYEAEAAMENAGCEGTGRPGPGD
jgi:hypothetical protein